MSLSARLSAVFSPRSIAVIGASAELGTVGNDILKNLTLGFRGKIYPVNLKGGEMFGLPVYKTIGEIPGAVDLAVIAVPAPVVAQVLEESGKKHVRAAIVLSSGFRESGNVTGEQLLVKIANKYGVTLVGPNCMGVMNPSVYLNATFAPTMPAAGSVAFVSQSGALGSAILDYAKSHGIVFSKFLSLGNKAMVDETAALEYFANDPDTKVILMYMEQLPQLAPILHTALKIRRTRQPKPIIVLKSGQSAQGMAAAHSHTGALAGNDAFYDALFREAGIIRAQSIEDLFVLAECFATNGAFPKDRVAVVTNAGGLGVLVTDALVKEKLQLAQLPPQTQEKLRAVLPPAASVQNPIDILGDAPAKRYQLALEIVLDAQTVDAVAVLLTPQSMTEVEETARVISAFKKTTKKPILVSFLGGGRVQRGDTILEKSQVDELEYPEEVAGALGALHRFSLWKNDPEQPKNYRDVHHANIKRILQRNKPGWLSQTAVFSILDACNIPTVPRITIHLPSQAERAVKAVGGTAVLKILSPDILHKSDAGGVVTNVTAKNAAHAYEHLLEHIKKSVPHAHITGVLVMQQINAKNQEMLLGAVRDPNLGALVGCGMGGVYTETFADATFELVPITHAHIAAMIDRLRIAPILRGSRGQQSFDRTALIDAIARISYLISCSPQIAELDINPLFILTKKHGVLAADARLRIA
jgi:acetyl coenzyme A synthetase (ADP forming)-like protein